MDDHKMGGRLDVTVLSIPLKADGEWQKVENELTRANVGFLEGTYERTVQECRHVVEGVATIMAATWDVPQSSNGFGSWVMQITGRLSKKWPEQEDRFKTFEALIKARWSWTSEAHPFDAIIPQREEVRFVILLVADLMGFSSQLLTALPNPIPKKGSAEGSAHITNSLASNRATAYGQRYTITRIADGIFEPAGALILPVNSKKFEEEGS